MARIRSSVAHRLDARELAATPTPDPYRHALVDPFADKPVPESSGLAPNAGAPPTRPAPSYSQVVLSPYGFLQRSKMPATAGWAVVCGFVLGGALAIFGVMLIAWLSLQSQVALQDRSFHRGGDAADLLIALIDLGLASVLLVATSSFASGKVAGRIGMTGAAGITLLLSAFWWHSERDVPAWLPVTVALVTVAMLALAYDRRVTRWLGVRPAPQPE